ncbi:MAG: sulfotransferase family 2 domain-containing protein [Opitutales bacterium]
MPDPNSFVVAERKTVFHLIPKCANSSVKAAILKAHGIRKRGNLHHEPFFQYISPAEAARMVDHWQVTVVRDPYSRFVSFYRQKIQDPDRVKPYTRRYGWTPDLSMEAVLERMAGLAEADMEIHFRPQWTNLVHAKRYLPDFTARLETLDADWAVIRQRYPGLGRLRHMNPTPGPKTPESLPAGVVAGINEVYGADFRWLDYAPAMSGPKNR